METFVIFDGEKKAIRFDNYTVFKMLSEGVGFGTLFMGHAANEAEFCRAWAFVLQIDFNGDAREFMNKFSDFSKLNEVVSIALQRDGIVNLDTDAGTKKNEKS